MRETPVTVVGTLVSNARPRRVGPEQALVLNLRVASNERRYDKASETWVDGDSLYLSVTCWRTLAENAASLVKGDPVIVTGRLRTREWTTEQGERRSSVEMEASALGPDLARCMATVRKPRRADDQVQAGDAEGIEQVGGAPEGAEEATGYVGVPGGESDEGARLSELADSARPLVAALT